MLTAIMFLSLLAAIILLLILSYIDLKIGLLPNEPVMGLAASGLTFHLASVFEFSTLEDMAFGALVGGGFLYLIRLAANIYYEEDALGLGDVKLFAAAGLWLGVEHILLALSIGAITSFIHGSTAAVMMAHQSKIKIDFKRYAIPAGPGFCFGILLVGLLKFHQLPGMLPG